MPILINAIPVSLGNDAYPIAIMASYLLHTYLPVLRDMASRSAAFKVRQAVVTNVSFSIRPSKTTNCLLLFYAYSLY